MAQPSDTTGEPDEQDNQGPQDESSEQSGTSDQGRPHDPWSDAVDRPGRSPEQSRPPMGFSSGKEPVRDSSRPADDDDDDAGDTGDLGAMLQQLLGGGLGGGQGAPDLGAIIRQLGGTGGTGGAGGLPGMPDLGELMRQFGMEPGENPGEAIAKMWKQMGIDPNNSSMMSMLQNQMQQFFSAQSPADRMGMSTDVARKTVAAEADPTVTAAQQREVDEAVRIAHLWVEPYTTLDAPTGSGLAWSRAEWVEATMPTWHRLVEPVSDGVTAAMTRAMDEQFARLREEGLGDGVPELPGIDVGGLLEHLQPALRQLAGSVFSAQLGHGVGALAADLLSATEVGLPLLDSEDVALLPANVAAFTEGLEIDAAEVRLYLAVREAARVRLFATVPWLGPQLEAAVRDYARNITIDTDAIEEQVRTMDLQNPAGIQEALQHKLFSPTPTPEQKAALARLETSLALVEGWVDLVTEQATSGHLPNAVALGETLRRRRIGGPAQKTFSGLVGLELSPRRLKDAKNLWAALESAGGIEFRDAPWEHPDIAPTGADLDDPLGYVEKRRDAGTTDDLDSALESLLNDAPAESADGDTGSAGDEDGPATDRP